MIPRFQSTGPVKEGGLYVKRPGDAELLAALLRGEYCYILAPRQIGKSSLTIQMSRELFAHGVRCAKLDLGSFGIADGTTEQWYFDLTAKIAEKLALPDPVGFWTEHRLMSPVHRFARFLRQQVLAEVPGRVVFFVDEIDSVLSLSAAARDDFIAAVRALFNARADDPEYERLIFCLLGVAMPSDLMADERRTPFNIARDIALEDFTYAEMQAFLPGLREFGDGQALLDEVFSWTDGHPYMTQKICQELGRSGPADAAKPAAARVLSAVDRLFLQAGLKDTNLSYADKRICDGDADAIRQRLGLYRRLLLHEDVPAESANPVQTVLRLTGMAAERRQGGRAVLRVRNRIFAQVFDQAWIGKRESDRLLASPLTRWLESGRKDDELLRGRALREAQAWADRRGDLSAEEMRFLRESQELAHEEAMRRERRKLWTIVGAFVLPLVCTLMGWDYYRALREPDRLLDCPLDKGAVCNRELGTYQEGCDMNDAAACARLGVAFEYGVGLMANHKRALSSLQRACQLGSDIGCVHLGDYYERGLIVGRDVALARALYEKACESDHVVGCNHLGLLYEKGQGVARDEGHAYQFYKKSCDAGLVAGCNNLGWLYHHGLGVARDVDRARMLYSRACYSTESIGCVNLGFLFEEGAGVPKEPLRAAALYRGACDLAVATGCTHLGYLYEKGLGLERNEALAAVFYQRGCDEDDGRGCNNLGVLYEAGLGVARDEAGAALLYEQACEAQYALGCHNLGVMYEEGRGRPKDDARALQLYRKACEGKEQDACARMKDLLDQPATHWTGPASLRHIPP